MGQRGAGRRAGASGDRPRYALAVAAGALALAREGDAPIALTARLEDAPGRWWRWSLRRLEDGGLLAQGAEVTDLALARREEQARSDLFYRSIPVMLHAIDARGHIEAVSDLWLERMKYRREEVVGRPSTDFLTEESRALAREVVLPDFFKKGYCYKVPYRFVTSEGEELDVLLSASSERSADGRFLRSQAVLEDVTDLLRAKAVLERQRALLLRSNADLERFAYIASHDLQEPLRKVTAFGEMLQGELGEGLDGDAAEYLSYVIDGANRMRGLIDDLLAYARLDARGARAERVEADEALAVALDDLSQRIREAGAEVRSDPLPAVLFDRRQLIQLFQNLIGNAIKYADPARPPRVHVSVHERATCWVFSVRDNGIGIDPRFHERVFLLFQRLHSRSRYPGTGLGLAICKRIVENAGGQMWLESAPGQGATFFFSVPFERPEPLHGGH